MAKIGYIIVCEDVFNDGDLIIKKPYNVISPYDVPGNFSFVLAFSIFDLKKDVKYKLKLEIIQPDEERLINHEVEFEYTPHPNDISTSGSLNLKFNNIVFMQQGVHTFRITIDNEISNEIQIPIIPAKK